MNKFALRTWIRIQSWKPWMLCSPLRQSPSPLVHCWWKFIQKYLLLSACISLNIKATHLIKVVCCKFLDFLSIYERNVQKLIQPGRIMQRHLQPPDIEGPMRAKDHRYESSPSVWEPKRYVVWKSMKPTIQRGLLSKTFFFPCESVRCAGWAR